MIFVCKQKAAYEVRISDWSSDWCSSDLGPALRRVYVREAEDLEALFAEHDYSLSALDTGVPRLATTALPRDMARVDDPEARKALFLRTLLPLVLQANAELRPARGKVMAALDAQAEGRPGAPGALWLADVERKRVA